MILYFYFDNNFISYLLSERDDGHFIPDPNASPLVLNGGIAPHAEVNLNAVPETPLLDTSASKTKAQLGHSGALANRRPPTKAGAPASVSISILYKFFPHF